MTTEYRLHRRFELPMIALVMAAVSSACSDGKDNDSPLVEPETIEGENIERSEFIGTPEIDILDGTPGNDRLLGEGGADLLSGKGGRDQFIGGPGNDVVVGGADNDIYYYNIGDRADIIRDEGGEADQLVFGAGISLDQVVITDRPLTLHIMIRDIAAQDSVTIMNWGQMGNFIETMVFDGKHYSHSEIEAAIVGNRRPKLVLPIEPQIAKVGEKFEFEIPTTAFVDPDDGDDLKYHVMDHHRSWLPTWLSQYSDKFGVFGTPTQADVEEFVLRVTVKDPGYRQAEVLVSVEVIP